MSLDFNLVSEFQTIQRRPFELAVPAILDPNNVRPLVIGEWLQLDSAYKMARGGDDNATTDDEAIVPSYVYFAEQGRYEVQAIQKGPFLYGGWFEADTKIMDAAAHGAISTIGQPVYVADVDVGGIVRRGLAGITTPAAGTIVMGYVSRLPSNNNGFLRFVRAMF